MAEPLDAGHIAAILREEKLIPVAQLAAFKDPISPRTDPSMAIHYNGSALWLDAQKNGNPWLNPYSTAAVEYVGDLVEEVQQLGFEQVVLTNACGGINRDFAPGTLMLITDFINMMGTNPLIGPNDERFGPRFPDMTEPYNLELQELAKHTAEEMGIDYKEGTYLGFMGPCYETAAEIRAFAGMGADAVGMSTVPETMVCNYMGMKVLAVSCITNMATGIQTVKHSHARVLEIANQAGDTMCRWLGAVIQKM